MSSQCASLKLVDLWGCDELSFLSFAQIFTHGNPIFGFQFVQTILVGNFLFATAFWATPAARLAGFPYMRLNRNFSRIVFPLFPIPFSDLYHRHALRQGFEGIPDRHA